MTSYRTGKSESGYGEDGASGSTQPDDINPDHPLAKKGYEIGSAANLQVGDVFEFLWADSNEFEWEWKCLGYVRFIVLRHSDTFPHHAVCIPISVGSRHNFAKPGIDASQQGFVFDDNSPDQWHEKLAERNRLYFPPVGIELNKGKFRVKEDSRANYADIIEIDHDAQIIVVGTVARYFDRLRRSVNKAIMRNILKRALTVYRDKKEKEAATPPKIEPSVVGQSFEDEDEEEDQVDQAAEEPHFATSTQPIDIPTPRDQRSIWSSEEKREKPRDSSSMELPRSRSHRKGTVEAAEAGSVKNDTRTVAGKSDYDLRSLHSVAMKGIKY